LITESICRTFLWIHAPQGAGGPEQLLAHSLFGEAEARFSVVIVHKDGGWDRDLVKDADAGKLLEVMGLTGWTPGAQPGVKTGLSPLPQGSSFDQGSLYALTAGCFAITLTALAMLWLG
jgi:hypothetical protein